NEVGQLMHADPGDGSVRLIARTHGRKHGAGGPDLLMAVHAGSRRRHTRERGAVRTVMTVAAVNAKTGPVMLVAERDRLGPCDAYIGGVRGADEDTPGPAEQCQQKNEPEHRQTGEGVETAVEYLGHVPSPALHGPMTGRLLLAGERSVVLE